MRSALVAVVRSGVFRNKARRCRAGANAIQDAIGFGGRFSRKRFSKLGAPPPQADDRSLPRGLANAMELEPSLTVGLMPRLLRASHCLLQIPLD